MPTRTVYLTIDDGPSLHMKEKLDFLLSHHIPAIWFCRGDYLKQSPHLAEHAINNGFVIGNHSYNHHSFSHLDLKMATREIIETDIIIEKIYKKTGIVRPAKIFRFPYGDKGGKNKQGIQDILLKCDYQQPNFKNINYQGLHQQNLNYDLDTFWTFDIEEYKTNDLEEILQKIALWDQSSTLQTNEIVLIHDHEKTTNLFFNVIERLTQMKLDFKLPAFCSNRLE